MHLSVLLAGIIVSSVLVAGHRYDNSSCKTLLPVTRRLWSTLGSAMEEPAVSSEETTEVDDDDDDDHDENEAIPVDLVPALERSPYKIETSSLKYRRNRVMTIKIEGSKLNGLLLQARQRFPSSISPIPTFIGNFIDMPEGFESMDCNPRDSPYKSNTVFNTNHKTKTSVQLNWKAPGDSVDSVEFVATVIRGKYYWTHIKSMPIFFNEFPPNFEMCGKKRSCQQLVRHPGQCEEGFCKDYVLMTEISDQVVTFYIGGNMEAETGFVGVAFTNDKKKLSILDLSVCRKKDQRTMDAANFRVNKSIGHMVKQPDYLSSLQYDIEGGYAWCSFSRALKIKDEPTAPDLSKELYYILIRGPLDSMTDDPFLPNDEDMLKDIKVWKPSETFNAIGYYGGSNVASLSWTLIVVVFLTSFMRLIQ